MNLQLPPYKEHPTLSTDRIMLRQIGVEDIKQVVDISFYDAKKAETVQEASAMQVKIDADYQNGNSIHWGITDKLTNELVGTCGYYRGFDNGIGELGCVLKSAFHKKGYMTPALQLAVDFGKNHIRLTKVIAITTTTNTPAIGLLNRLKFIKTEDLADNEVKYEFLLRD